MTKDKKKTIFCFFLSYFPQKQIYVMVYSDGFTKYYAFFLLILSFNLFYFMFLRRDPQDC